jgi:hypothetical protein
MASDAAGHDAPPGEPAAHHRSVAPADLAWPAGYRSKSREPESGGAPPAGSPAAEPRRRNLAGLGLGALRIGPALMLLVVLLVAGALSPVFFTTRNVGNVLSQTAVPRGAGLMAPRGPATTPQLLSSISSTPGMCQVAAGTASCSGSGRPPCPREGGRP